MIPVYDVQTFYGTHQKTFQNRRHAEDYVRKLAEEIDLDLIEMHRREVTVEEFNLTDLED